MTPQMMALLLPVIVPLLTAGLHKVGTKINANWPTYLKPFKALILSIVMQKIYSASGIKLPADLTSVNDAFSQALLTSPVLLTAMSVFTREIVDQGKKIIAKYTAPKATAPPPTIKPA